MKSPEMRPWDGAEEVESSEKRLWVGLRRWSSRGVVLRWS